MPRNKKNTSEYGNVFVFVLLGIVLFAALSFTLSRGMRNETTGKLTGQKAVLAATDILDYSEKIARAVNRLRDKGLSENDISFDQSFVAGYAAGTDETKIFSPSGGAVSWKSPQTDVNDGSEWVYTGANCITDSGTGGTGCDSDGSTTEELLAVLPNLTDTVCEELNKQLKITGILANTGSGISVTQFAGSFADGKEITLAGGPLSSACFSYGGNNFFYTVLIAR